MPQELRQISGSNPPPTVIRVDPELMRRLITQRRVGPLIAATLTHNDIG